MVDSSHHDWPPTRPEDEGSMSGSIDFEVESLVERLGMGLLLLVLAAVLFVFGLFLGVGIDYSLHHLD